MRFLLLSLVFFLAVRHASPTSMDELPSSISDILEDRNLIPTNFKMVNFSSQRQEEFVLKFDVVKALWRHNNPDCYILVDWYYIECSFTYRILGSGEVATVPPHFDPSQKIVHIVQSEGDNSTHSEYAQQLFRFLSGSLVKIQSGDNFLLFQGTTLENWHNLEIMKHSSLRFGKLTYCTGDNSIYLEVSVIHREIVEHAIHVEVRPLGHFEANRTEFVESFDVSKILFVDRGDDFDVLFDPDCGVAKMTCLFSDGYYKWCDYSTFIERRRELMGNIREIHPSYMRRLEFIICSPREEEADTPFGSITTTSLKETRVAKSQLGYVVETAEEEFFARFPSRTSAIFKVPESGVILLRCPEGTVFLFPNDTVVKKFVCEDVDIDDIEIREDPIGNWTEDEATSSTQIPATTLPAIKTEDESTSGLVITMIRFIAVVLVAVAGGVWKWRNGKEQNEEGENDVERMTHEDTSQLNSKSEHTWTNVNFDE